MAIINSTYLTKRLQCSYKDKLECFEMVKYILDLANIARSSGIFALEEEINKNKMDSMFLKNGINLITDGIDPEYVRKYMEHYIASNNYKGKGFLNSIVIMEGVIAIQLGHTKYIIAQKLLSYFGIEFEKEFREFDTKEVEVCREKIECMYKDTKPYSKNTLFLEEYADINDRSLQFIIRKSDFYELGLALKGASGRVKTSFLINMSQERRKETISSFDCFNYETIEKAIIKAQKSIVQEINKLEYSGEIVINNTNFKHNGNIIATYTYPVD